MTSNPTATDFDIFLASMTFAAGGGIGCDCDECECPAPGDEVPPTIRNAVDEHLRKRKLEEPSVFEGSKRLYIRQNRELVKREAGFSIWRLDLPLDGGDPIVEYRNSHRILFVQQLDKPSDLFSIGKGIIGSAAEESSRKRLDWEQNASYFLPYSKGIACGWIHKLAEDEANLKVSAAEGSSSKRPIPDLNDVVIYSVKVSPETLDKMIAEGSLPEDTDGWVKEAYELFQQCLAKTGQEKGGDDSKSSDDGESTAIQLSEEECLKSNFIIELAK